MADPIVTDVKTDLTKAKAWYASHLFWAGAIAGVIVALVVRHFV
jgi:hypothetical protein